jgi:hypothetical protein
MTIYAIKLTKPYVAYYEVSYVEWNEHYYHEKHHIQHEVPMEITRTVNIKFSYSVEGRISREFTKVYF